MSNHLCTDETRVAGWFLALNALAADKTELKKRPIAVAREMLRNMHRQPHRFARLTPLPDAFHELLRVHGIELLEKGAIILARMNVVELKAPKAPVRPMQISLVVIPEGPLTV